MRIVEVMRDEEKLLAPGDLVLQPGDILLVRVRRAICFPSASIWG